MTVATTEPPRSSPRRRFRSSADEGHHLVPVDDPPILVDHDQAVRIAIERDADMRTAGDDGLLQQLRLSRPTARH